MHDRNGRLSFDAKLYGVQEVMEGRVGFGRGRVGFGRGSIFLMADNMFTKCPLH